MLTRRAMIMCVVMASMVVGATTVEATDWQLWVGLGYARGFSEYVLGAGGYTNEGFEEDEMPDGSLGFQLGARTQLSHHLTLGLETGYLHLGNTDEEARPCVPLGLCGMYMRQVAVSVVPTTAQLSYLPWPGRLIAPDLTVGLGLYTVINNIKAKEHPTVSVCCGPLGDFGTQITPRFGVNVGAGFPVNIGDSGLRLGIAGRVHCVVTSEKPLWIATVMVQFHKW